MEIHVTAQQNKLNMRHRKESIQMQTEQMICFKNFSINKTGMSPPNCIALIVCNNKTINGKVWILYKNPWKCNEALLHQMNFKKKNVGNNFMLILVFLVIFFTFFVILENGKT